MKAKQRNRKIERVFILCNSQGGYGIYITRKDQKKKRYYIKPAKHFVFDLLSQVSNYRKDEFETTMELSIFPTISIIRRKQL